MSRLTQASTVAVFTSIVVSASITAAPAQPIAMRLITDFPDGYGSSVPADADHDGRSEIHGTRLVAPNTGDYDVLERDGINRWTLVSRMPNQASMWDGGDSDQDGRFEVLRDTVANGIEVFESADENSFPSQLVYSNPGTGGFQAPPRFANDLDGDGRREVLWTRSNGTSLEVVVLENTGDNTYEEVAHLLYGSAVNYPEEIASGDLDGDGRGDIVTGDSAGNVTVFENRGDNAYDPVWQTHLDTPWNVTGFALLGDADGDGLSEFAAVVIDPGPMDHFYILEAMGDDQYLPVFVGAIPGGGNHTLHAFDLDGDGRKELVVGVGNRIQIWRATANDTWEMIWEAPAGGRFRVEAVVADVNNNGFGEILYTNAYPDNYHSFLVEWPFRADASQNDLDRPGDALFTFRNRAALRQIQIRANSRDVTRRIRDFLRAGDPRVSMVERGDETVLRLDLPSLGFAAGQRLNLSVSGEDRGTGEAFEDHFTYVGL